MSLRLSGGVRSVRTRNAPDIDDDPSGGYATAPCRDEDPELFFPIGTSGPALLQVEEARKVCHRCPIAGMCLKDSLARGDEFGMFGGMTPEERKLLDPPKPTRPCLVCGSDFQPPRKTQSTCTPCQMRTRDGGTTQLEAFLRKFADELRQACREGVSDKAFAEQYNLSHHLVGRARTVLGIAPVSKGGGPRGARSRVGAGV